MTKPTALLLADDLEKSAPCEAAAMLRAQHELIGELVKALTLMVRTHDEPADTLLQEARERKWLANARGALLSAKELT